MTQSILIGSPLQLTRKGILELHKLKHKETWVYRVDTENFPFDSESSVTKVSEEDYINDTIIKDTKLGMQTLTFLILPIEIPSVELTIGGYERFIETMEEFWLYNTYEVAEALSFTSKWEYPNDHQRKDKDLLRLYNLDREEYFENNPRKLIIPKDVEWYIDEAMGREYIREKARVWT